MKTDILIDADTLMYRVGFATPTVDSAENACARLMNSISKVSMNVFRAYGLDIHTMGEVILFITSNFGKGRYRDKFNKETEYKANRGKGASPVFMEEMREYLLKNYIVMDAPSHLYEADDQLSWVGWYRYYNPSREYVICGVDKDLNQIPGQHWDYGKNYSYSVTPEEADWFFFNQLLTGDLADGIPGIRGIGNARAQRLLEKGTTPEEWWDIVLDTYTNKMPEKSPEEISDILYERGNKLWIQRYEGQTWYPPVPPAVAV